jgi:putative membrane protein
MKQFLKLLQWTLNAAVFFTLFAFALNNQHEAKVYFFFGTQWRSPMVLIVLIAFALGMVVGVLGMVPRWWRQKQAAKAVQTTAAPVSSPTSPSSSASSASTATTPSEVSHGA